jgi:SNF2 family DNA or RNA helicase
VQIHEAKLEALKEIIEFSDTPVLVFYTFQADRDLILEKIPGSKQLKDDADIKDWNSGKIPVLLAHPASAGYGLNLQEGGRVIVWYGLPWSLEQYQQAVARLHRQGQKLPVLNYQILAEGTVDENVAASLEAKDVTQESLLRLLKARR